jgi:ferredoxin
METGQRYRTWDGCMLAEFAAVAGGHNFRDRQAARYRHRYNRKGLYMWDNIGEIACVGCGRCITACTANIANPVEVYNRLLEEA